MKELISTFCLTIGLLVCVWAQPNTEKVVKTTLHEVTVYQSGAQLFEKGSVLLKKGEWVVVVRGRSPYLDSKSVQVKGKGDFTILGVTTSTDFISQQQSSAYLDSLSQKVEEEKDLQKRLFDRMQVIGQKEDILRANQVIGEGNPSVQQLKSLLDFQEAELGKYYSEKLALQQKSNDSKKRQQVLEGLINKARGRMNYPLVEIRVPVRVEQEGQAEFSFSYLVANAGWYPKYDLRVNAIDKPVELIYKAEVHQNTGLDWNQVKLKFSNANPNQGSNLPTLSPWLLNFARHTYLNSPSLYDRVQAGVYFPSVKGIVRDSSGEPIQGANVIIKGTTIGTVTDLEGTYTLAIPQGYEQLEYSFIGYKTMELPISGAVMNVVLQEDVQQLQEVVVTAYGQKAAGVRLRGFSSISSEKESREITSTTLENQTSLEFVVDEPYTVKSNGEKKMVQLKKLEIPAEYQYVAVPKIEKEAFLIARITDWEKHKLLTGEANLYLESGYVGRSILNVDSFEDTLQVSLGRDKSIVVQREANEQFYKKRTLGINVSESRGFSIQVKNTKSGPINLRILDQIPVSVREEIVVEAKEINKALLVKETGILQWDFRLAPSESKELDFSYEVKYPRKENVILE